MKTIRFPYGGLSVSSWRPDDRQLKAYILFPAEILTHPY